MKSRNAYVLGIDLGGTQVRAALTGPDGMLATPLQAVPTEAHTLEREALYARIRDLAITVRGDRDIEGIGIGATGPVDPESGTILDCNNLPTFQHFPLCERLQADFGVPARMDGDARALILGEALFGAGKHVRRVFGLTLGTGLGSALVEDGRIVRGSTGCSGEIWTAPYRDGTMEDYLSGTALSQHFTALTGETVSGKEVADLARAGSPEALAVFRTFADALADTMAWCTGLFDPDLIILGGSVTESAPLFMDRALERFHRFICTPARAHIRVALSSLGSAAGVIGAGALAWRKNT